MCIAFTLTNPIVANYDGLVKFIIAKINGMRYVGQTTISLEAVISRHIKAKTYLGFALRKHKKENFNWEIIDTAESREELNQKEIKWIEDLNSMGNSGYNLHYGGNSHSGWKLPELTKKAQSLAYIGRTSPMKGRTTSSIHAQRISIALKGKPRSQETKEKISNTLKGSIFSDSHKKALSEARKTRIITSETRKKLSEASIRSKLKPTYRYVGGVAVEVIK